MDSSLGLQIGFSLVAIVAAGIGVFMANDASRYAELGEAPDYGGGAFFAGNPGSAFEEGKQFYIDLRTHYRRSSSVLASTANFVLLMSVVAGVLAGFTNQVIVASALGALWIVFVIFLIAFVQRRRAPMKEREADLEQRRVDYNDENYQRTARLVDEEYAKATFHPIEQFERVRW